MSDDIVSDNPIDVDEILCDQFKMMAEGKGLPEWYVEGMETRKETFGMDSPEEKAVKRYCGEEAVTLPNTGIKI